jgi:ABC-type branched-subunit amino acid transport system permease subunit
LLSASPPWARRWLLAVALLTFWGFATLPSLLYAAFAITAGDASGSNDNGAIMTFVMALWALPVLTVTAAIVGFVGALRGSWRTVVATSTVAIADALLALAAFWTWSRQG